MSKSKETIEFDLDTCLTIEYNYDNLKIVLAHLLKEQKEQKDTIDHMKKQLEIKQISIDQLKKDVTRLKSFKIDELTDKVDRLADKVYNHDDKFMTQQSNIDSLSMNFMLINRTISSFKRRLEALEEGEEANEGLEDILKRLKDLEEKIQILSSLGGGGEGEGDLNLDELDKKLKLFRLDFLKDLREEFASKDLEERVKALEEKLKEFESEIHDLEDIKYKIGVNSTEITRLNEIIRQINETLLSKCDNEKYQYLLNLVNSLQEAGPPSSEPTPTPVTGGSLSKKDQLLIAKIPGLEKLLQQLLEEYDLKKMEADIRKLFAMMEGKADKMEITQINNEIKEMQERMTRFQGYLDDLLKCKISTESWNQLKQKVELIEVKLANIIKNMGELSEKLKATKSERTEPVDFGPKIGEDDINALNQQIQDLRDKITQLQNRIHGLTNEINNRFENIDAQFPLKLDVSIFEDFKNQLNTELKNLINGINKKMADKNETKKALKHLERQIKSLFEMISKEHYGADEHDAMFSKKPLGGMSCASCQKDLINLQGQMANYYAWSKFPLRDPTERLARVGHGFSRMLSMLKPETISKYQAMGAQKFSQAHGGPNVYDEQFVEDPHRMTQIEEEYSKSLSKTQHEFFSSSAEGTKRPSTASHLPSIPQAQIKK